MFIDEVKIKVISWKGWDWLVSWRREKYIPKGWPWGWDGWRWWDVFLFTDENINTLSEYRHKKVLEAKHWENWWQNLCHWANAPELILKVPVWTIVRDVDSNEIIADLSENNAKLLLVKWWRWGYWNAHFVSSTRQAPAFAELWDVSAEKNLLLELKLVADVWIIWIPSAWKSTLISVITNVKPKIGDYPFTTLTPNLWVLDHKWKSLVIEDVPWLIPWASEWKGLWIDFLKHIERTGVLLHMLDLYRLDEIFSDYENIRKELILFSESLATKEEIIVLSKADLLDEEMINFILEEFKKRYPNKKVFVISSWSFLWIEKLKDYLVDNYSKVVPEKIDEYEEKPEVKLYDLKNEEDDEPRNIKVYHEWDYIFRAKWERLEQIVRMTNFDNSEAVLRVFDVLDKMWVIKKVEKELKNIMNWEELDNSFYFEWSEERNFSPKIVIANREIPLDRLKYNL